MPLAMNCRPCRGFYGWRPATTETTRVPLARRLSDQSASARPPNDRLRPMSRVSERKPHAIRRSVEDRQLNASILIRENVHLPFKGTTQAVALYFKSVV
jgi:hypothetical protein